MSPEGINRHIHTHSKLTENHSLLREFTHTHTHTHTHTPKLIANHSRQIGLKHQLLSSIPIQRCQ